MKVIFDRRTEVGKCDSNAFSAATEELFGSGELTLFGQTTASMAGSRGMLRVEHRCFLALAAESPEHPLGQAEVSFEPVFGSEEETLEIARKAHLDFLARAAQTYLGERLVEH